MGPFAIISSVGSLILFTTEPAWIPSQTNLAGSSVSLSVVSCTSFFERFRCLTNTNTEQTNNIPEVVRQSQFGPSPRNCFLLILCHRDSSSNVCVFYFDPRKVSVVPKKKHVASSVRVRLKHTPNRATHTAAAYEIYTIHFEVDLAVVVHPQRIPKCLDRRPQ